VDVGKLVNCVQDKGPYLDLGIYLHHNKDAVNKTGNEMYCTYNVTVWRVRVNIVAVEKH